MGQFLKMVQDGESIDKIAQYLDKLSHSDRLAEMYKIKGKWQEKLFGMGKKEAKMDIFFPSLYKVEEEIMYHGMNSLPIFNFFKKPIFKTGDPNLLIGYNKQPMMWLTGPGYFAVMKKPETENEITFDYTVSVTSVISGWPKPVDNKKGISKFVYGGLRDEIRTVSNNIYISKAVKQNKSPTYFILCREDKK